MSRQASSRIVAIGVGCRAGVAGEAIAALARRALEEAGAPEGERRMFTLAAKADEPGLIEAARIIGVTLTPLPLAALNAQAERILTPSAPAQARFGAPNIAEAAALAGAGEGGRLLGPRLAADGATCAIALIPGAAMTVHFIGAGPGAPDLITMRGRDLIARCPVCLYAGSLVPRALLDHCPPGARIVDTAPLDLDAIIALCVEATANGQDVARLHSGDLSIWSAMGEQLRRLKRAGVPYTVTPGVPAFAAAAAALERELTLPGLAQSLVLTRTSGRASPMPERETLANFAATGATLAIHLSIHALKDVVAELIAVLWARLSGGDRRPRLMAGRADRARDAWRNRRRAARDADRAHGAHPRRPGARGRGLSRERTLQRGLCAAVSRGAPERGRMSSVGEQPALRRDRATFILRSLRRQASRRIVQRAQGGRA